MEKKLQNMIIYHGDDPPDKKEIQNMIEYHNDEEKFQKTQLQPMIKIHEGYGAQLKNEVEDKPPDKCGFLNTESFPNFIMCDNINTKRLLDPFPENDIGRAERVLAVLDIEIVYNYNDNILYFWNNKYWETIHEMKFQKKVMEIAKIYGFLSVTQDTNDDAKRCGMYSTIRTIISTIKVIKGKSSVEFNRTNKCICVKNGVFDFTRNQLCPHSYYKNAYITYMVDVDYIRNYRDEIFDNFLLSIMLDSENCTFLQTVLGYPLLGEPVEQQCYFLHGSGANGKSTLIETIQKLLGSLTTTMQIDYFTSSSSQNPNAPSPAVYQFKDKLYVFSSEVSAGADLNDAVLKKHIGGGKLMGRKAYGNLVEFDNKSVLFIDANHLPHFKEGGYSMERRIMVIPFSATFDKRNIDLHMSQKLAHKSCQTAILSWLIEGALRYMSFGLLPTKRVQEATAEYFSSENTIKMFLKEATTEDVSGKVYFSDLYSAYEYYCKQNILQPKSKDVFSKSAEIKKYPNKKDGINRYRQGIRLKTEYENILEKEN